jgi:hypothetical protein
MLTVIAEPNGVMPTILNANAPYGSSTFDGNPKIPVEDCESAVKVLNPPELVWKLTVPSPVDDDTLCVDGEDVLIVAVMEAEFGDAFPAASVALARII